MKDSLQSHHWWNFFVQSLGAGNMAIIIQKENQLGGSAQKSAFFVHPVYDRVEKFAVLGFPKIHLNKLREIAAKTEY